MYPVPHPFAWQQAVADFALNQWKWALQAQTAAVRSFFPPAGKAKLNELQETVSAFHKRLDELEQTVKQLGAQEPRLIYLEHELASLRADLAQHNQTASAGSTPSPKTRTKSKRSKASQDVPNVEN